MPLDGFGPCEICVAESWIEAYRGSIRDGAFGKHKDQAVIGRCGGCGVERLAEAFTKKDDFYQGPDYRAILEEPADAADLFEQHDMLQLQKLEQLWPESLRGKVIADVGCGAGSFLDHVRGLPARAIAIEPCRDYHDLLVSRGYEVYARAAEAAPPLRQVDWAFSFSVIEHVGDPRAFLSEIRDLLKPGGRLLISTPNRLDVLMSLLPDAYPSFFYRVVHRWYFDSNSLAGCAERAGLKVLDVRCVHRFGLSNALIWLRDRQPRGRAKLPYVSSPLFDAMWVRGLEAEGVGDYLYAVLAREEAPLRDAG